VKLNAAVPQQDFLDIEVAAIQGKGNPFRLALPQKSAKPTNDNSPPIYRWDWAGNNIWVREADGWVLNVAGPGLFSRPLHGLQGTYRVTQRWSAGLFSFSPLRGRCQKHFWGKPVFRSSSASYFLTMSLPDCKICYLTQLIF